MPVSTTFSPKLDVAYSKIDALPPISKLMGYATADTKKSLWQIVNTAIPFGMMWVVTYKSLAYPYWVTLLLSVPTALFVVRLFIMQHDAGHGSFFRSHKANDFIGFWIGILTLSPYQYWQKTHAIHHATSGNLDKRGFGDIDTLTVTEYDSLSTWERFKYRAYRHPLTMFVVGPFFQFVIKHRFPYNIPPSWKREWRSVHLTNLVLLGVLLLAWSTIGVKNFLLVQIPVTFLSCFLGAWLFYIQHQYPDTYWKRDKDWDYFQASVKGSSYYVLPKILQWFTGSIGLHHIHHYNSRIPNYGLQKCFDENPEFQSVTRLTIRSSLACIRLALWDEEKQKLISFKTHSAST
jgi:omega-6 fatty acid desaturase (delta-12 desaturase)